MEYIQTHLKQTDLESLWLDAQQNLGIRLNYITKSAKLKWSKGEQWNERPPEAALLDVWHSFGLQGARWATKVNFGAAWSLFGFFFLKLVLLLLREMNNLSSFNHIFIVDYFYYLITSIITAVV